MKCLKSVFLCIAIFNFLACSSESLEQDFDCNGLNIKFNDYERYFKLDEKELSDKKDFFMNQITIFGKFKNKNNNLTLVTFNKINHTLELKNSSKLRTIDCVELKKQ